MTSAIKIDHITHHFGKVLALNDLSLNVKQGEIYGFLGRNGAGKTTTLKMLMGILRPDTGMIELLGQQLKHVPVVLKQRIGYVSQEPTYYPWMTAFELGRFVGSFYPKWDAAEFLRLLRLLDVPTDRRSSEMSGGTRTKLGLALALAPRPELLLLDEPTTGLDPVARSEFNDQLMALQREQDTTVLFSSHLVGEVEQLAQRVGIVQAGHMRFEGEIALLRSTVRRCVQTTTEISDMPREGFERLRGDIFRADPVRWERETWPEGTGVQLLSLEDIFLAFARTDDVVL